MRFEDIKYITKLHQKINKLTDELEAIKEHLGIELVYRPGRLVVEQYEKDCTEPCKGEDIIIMEDED